jgi:carbamoyl-phosphate synthase large subunit
MSSDNTNDQARYLRILLTSVGRRSYLVKYFQTALGNRGEVHVANSTAVTPAFTLSNKHVVTPLIYDSAYIPFLLDYCKKNQISVLISLFDVDLPALAANKQKFADAGVEVIISSETVVNTCNDKWETYLFCKKHGFHTPKTYVSLPSAHDAIHSGELNFPVIVKPRWGMGSIGVFEANTEIEMDVLYTKVEEQIMSTYLKYESAGNKGKMVLIQEKLSGTEHGLDIINDLNGNYQNTIVKRKLAMRAGETDCAETIENESLKNLGEMVGKTLHHIANLDVDVFLVDGIPYVLEMNARFGGGYPFSHLAGVNLPLAIIKWIRGEPVKGDLLKARPGIVAHKDIDLVILSPTNFNTMSEIDA